MSIKITVEIIGNDPVDIGDQLVVLGTAMLQKYLVVPEEKARTHPPAAEPNVAREPEPEPKKTRTTGLKKPKPEPVKEPEPEPETTTEPDDSEIGQEEPEQPSGDEPDAGDPAPAEGSSPEKDWLNACNMLMAHWQKGEDEKVAVRNVIESYGVKQFKDIPKEKGTDLLAKAKELIG